MTEHAHGPFNVKLTAHPHQDNVGDAAISRMSIDKQFHGELEAASLGQMLAFRSAVQGSAGYVAMERVIGSLKGRNGSFVLQHSGTMDRGCAALVLTVVPDSGTGQLAGLSGQMEIVIADGKHSYAFDYALANHGQ